MSLRYRPALDGVRGFAVLAVVAFHSIGVVRGGDLGVDVFFVLSGFLITGLLLVEQDRKGHIDFRRFYIRRALRLGPALAVTLVLVGVLMLDHDVRAKVTTSVVGAFFATAFYVNNWLNVAQPNSTGPLGHTWSLSVEEQFYLVWPFVFAWLLRRRSRGASTTSFARGLTVAIVAFAVVRAAWWIVDPGIGVGYATTSRADQLLIGALAALLVRERAALVPWPVAGGALSALGVLCLALDANRDRGLNNLGLLTVIGVLAAVLIIHAGTAEGGPVVRLLSLRPLVVVGKVSYGLYLYHWPVFMWVATRDGWGHPLRFAVEYTVTAALTAASYLLIERPALGLKKRFETVQTGELEPDVAVRSAAV